MEIKAIFFDIDGTLVPFGDHRPPQEVIEAITALRARGIKVFVATDATPYGSTISTALNSTAS